MHSDAETVIQYLKDLPPERQAAVKKVRQVILENLPDTHNKKPLMYAALANQKNHIAVYLTGIYADQAKQQDFEKAYKATGKRYDVGKSCVRFKKLDDLPLDVLGEAIAAIEMKEFIEFIEKAQSPRKASKENN